MTTLDEAVQVAIDTLAAQCSDKSLDTESDLAYGRRQAADAILNYHRDMTLIAAGGKGINVNMNVNGAMPVRPVMRSDRNED